MPVRGVINISRENFKSELGIEPWASSPILGCYFTELQVQSLNPGLE